MRSTAIFNSHNKIRLITTGRLNRTFFFVCFLFFIFHIFFWSGPSDAEGDVYTEMDINTIINGGKTAAGTDFPGLIPLVNSYVATLDDADVDTCCTISRYFKLLSDRAAGNCKDILKILLT